VSPRLQPGDPAPDFARSDADGRTVSLSNLRGQKIVLYAYPEASTPGCTTQACDFRDSLASLQGAGYTVLGLSPDPPAALARFRDEQSLTYPLLSDPDTSVLRAYGAYGDKTLYGKVVQGVIRSTFVIDEEGRVERAMYGVKATGHVARLRRDLGLDAASVSAPLDVEGA
jgi:peroxiredoxin Q/BCP